MILALKLAYFVAGLVIPIILVPFFLLHPRGRKNLSQRFGFWNLKDKVLWAHAASAGEMKGLIPILRKAKSEYPDLKILATATSISGLNAIEKEADYLRLLPFDNPLWFARALKNIEITSYISGETEIWPFLMSYLERRKVPKYWVNARISDFSLPRYQRLRSILAPLLSDLRKVFACDAESAKRLLSIGVDPSKLLVTGNAKYDHDPKFQDPDLGRQLRQRYLGNAELTVVLGSIRPGEQGAWFAGIKRMRERGRNLNLVVVPRHIEKSAYFAREMELCGITFRKWSDSAPDRVLPTNTLLLDAFGHLEEMYSIADIAFIGGTVMNFGGHNPLEAAAYGCCLAVGPNTQNVRELVEQLEVASAINILHSDKDVLSLLESDLDRIKQSGQRAKEVWARNRGAAQRAFEGLKECGCFD